MLNIVTFGWRGWPLRCRKIWWFTVTINEPAIWLRWFYLLKALAFADSAGLRKYTNLFFIIVVTSLTGYRKKQCVNILILLFGCGWRWMLSALFLPPLLYVPACWLFYLLSSVSTYSWPTARFFVWKTNHGLLWLTRQSIASAWLFLVT